MYCAVSSRSRISSTLVLVAASTSSRSTKRPASISVHARHLPHGCDVMPLVSQLSALARMRASVVLPVPRVPGEQVRVVQALGLERVDERRDDVRLADDLLEDPGTPLAGEDLIRHRVGERSKRYGVWPRTWRA